jgi:subtilisin family serine protease
MILSRRTVCFLGLCFVGVVLSSAALGQPPQPPKPAKFKVQLRYYIPSPRDQHVALYKEMVDYLQGIGFDFQPKVKEFPHGDYEDRGKNILTGSIAGDKLLKCLNNRSVASLLVVPDDYKLPEDIGQPVKVRLELHSGFQPDRAFTLSNQVRALLKQFDFVEATGYDHRGYTGRPFTRLVGWIPVEYLETLLKDLRTQPTGWFTPRLEKEALPLPINLVSPIVITEVLPDPDVNPPKAKTVAEAPWYLDKLSPGLRARFDDKATHKQEVRTQIFLALTPPDTDDSYRALLQEAAPRLFIEGRTGAMVTALLPIGQLDKLAALPHVSSIRLAEFAPLAVDPALKWEGDNAKALENSGLAALHKAGFKGAIKGKAVRIGIIDNDFRGYKEMVADGKLPASTRLVDLTITTSYQVLPEPWPTDARTIGHGTHCALAAALAAPQADITLIRIDPTSLPQLELATRVINGELVLSDSLAALDGYLKGRAKALDGFRDELAVERKEIMEMYEDEVDIRRDYEILGPAVRGWLFSAREWHLLRVAELERGRAELLVVQQRFGRLLDDIATLKGIQIVSTSLTWNTGYPLGGASPLSRWFDGEKCQQALWFMSAGNTANQTWTGPYRDVNANGVMEFLPAGAKLPAGSWTPELSFLAWQPHRDKRVLELPEGAKVRVTLQWREPHDPSYFFNPNEPDRYLKPLADMRLVALYQRDPEAKVLPADDFDVVGWSPLLPQRLDNQPGGSTYEQVVEFTAAKAGRYAIRVERQLPNAWILEQRGKNERPLLIELTNLTATGIRPAGAPALPALESQWELQPRLFVEVMDLASAAKGRAVFRDFSTDQGSIPILADTRSLVAVGAVTLTGERQPYSTRGAPGTLSYFLKPNVLAYDALQLTPEDGGAAYGASLSTPFAAGMAATLLSAGRTKAGLDQFFLKQTNKVLRAAAK